MAKKEFELLQAVWVSGSEQLPAGSTVTFPENEPTGIFIGRVKELTQAGDALEIASPAKPGADGSEQMPAETSSDAAPVPAPPAARK